MGVKNEELLRFYAETGKGEDYPITRMYMEKHTLSGDYIDLANVFREHGPNATRKKTKKEEEETVENERFWQWFKDNYTSPEMRSLSYIMKEDPHFDFLLKETGLKDPLLQKWHLYVSFYAVEEYWAKKEKKKESRRLTEYNYKNGEVQDDSGIFRGKTSCQALLLWMYEAAVKKTRSHELKHVEYEIKKGTLDGYTIWEKVSGGKPTYLKDRIINLIEKYYSHSTEGSEA